MWRKVPLYQGNGAIAWASPEFQAQHPCFVIAPEFDEIIMDDTSTASNYLDATINLIKHLKTKLPIDGKRLYTTGQSGGGMMSIALRLRFRQRTVAVDFAHNAVQQLMFFQMLPVFLAVVSFVGIDGRTFGYPFQ